MEGATTGLQWLLHYACVRGKRTEILSREAPAQARLIEKKNVAMRGKRYFSRMRLFKEYHHRYGVAKRLIKRMVFFIRCARCSAIQIKMEIACHI